MVKRTLSPDALVLVAALLLFAGLSYQMAQQVRPPKNEGDHPRRTTHSALPGGWKAWYLLLRERGAVVKQAEGSPSSWEKSSADIVVCGPEWEGDALSGEGFQNRWTDADANAAIQWVEDGGVLLMATDVNNKITDKAGLDLEEDPQAKSAREGVAALPKQPAAFFNGVESIVAPGKPYLSRAAKEGVTLLARGDKTVMVARTRGDGMIIVLTSPGAFDNAHLKGPNARFAAQVVEAFGTAADDNEKAKPPTVVFDEYHQGYRESDGFWEAVGRPGQLAALQILALALLTVYGAGKRFGLPMPLPTASRVSSEYVTSLADLYRRARAYDAVLEGVYQSFWRDLCRTVGVPADTPTNEVVRRASAALAPVGTKADDIEARLTQLTRDCEEKIAGGPQSLNEADLLRLARALSEMRKELELGGA